MAFFYLTLDFKKSYKKIFFIKNKKNAFEHQEAFNYFFYKNCENLFTDIDQIGLTAVFCFNEESPRL